MEITNEQRDQAYKTATNKQRFLYATPESGRQLYIIANKYQITNEEQYTIYVTLVGDVILNLIDQSNLASAFANSLGIDTEKSLRLKAEITDFLNQEIVSDDTKSNTDLESEIIETENIINNIPQIRTLDSDIKNNLHQENVIHTSSQDYLLRK